ncbi:Coenzyme F420 hydrogenase/dehydrogenase, beta subunit C-terminal domain (plasmid) [Rhizobium sp. CB3090]|uniref:Coenzyme F420 hydrogenase/dehydrogenase, beta subunit C-terminal domain n=1 Tax=Rhizobium sp. CB3090 TaxID=3039156 RepID=UPI0024B173F8|nr:Coenzyme F420 hydrogenase/dehydrogenase, beta subunit C-terminal domain [Rhizobium sp. CB3090]WFU11671.1 Coenzyme F420 hydrogenase/dehydrogenase, beta subunit C-terminal domain [Rhizobium sp. CB3090]
MMWSPTSAPQMQFDRYGQLKPKGANLRQSDQTAFSRICPFSPAAENEDELAARHFADSPNNDPLLGRFEKAFVGHVEEGDFRRNGSSGGLVTWVAAEMLRRGLVDAVAHVIESRGSDRLFRYTLSRSLADLKAGAKSRYYPVDLAEVLGTIRTTPGRYAIVGIPCFIKAVRLSCANDPILNERIVFTLGLFCGHMKSARMAESFAWQMGQRIGDVERFDYRAKCPDRPANWYRAQMKLRSGDVVGRDWWHLADGDWGAGFFQNPACNFCDDVVAETADIAFGDAWAQPYTVDGRGTNVVIVRSPALLDLVAGGMASRRIALSPVDTAFVVATQAAGFRQRREGLAFRLTWLRLGLRPRKRVVAGSGGLTWRRRMIYRMRYAISLWSHRVFWLARLLGHPQLYLAWARMVLSFYHGFAYSRGPIGRVINGIARSGAEGD